MRVIATVILFTMTVAWDSACKKPPPPQPVDIDQVTFFANDTLFSILDTEAISFSEFPWLALEMNAPGVMPDSLFMLCTIGLDTSGDRVVMNVVVNSPIADPLRPGRYRVLPSTSPADTQYIHAVGKLQYTFTSRKYQYLVSDTVTVLKVANNFAEGTFSATFASAPGSTEIVHISEGKFRGVQVQYYIGRLPE